jgi:phage tail P2-like protein
MSLELVLQKLLDACPPSIAYDPQVQAACTALDAEFKEVTQVINSIIILPNIGNPKIVSDELLEILAWQLHVDFWHAEIMPEATRREVVMRSLEWHSYKGTPWVVRDMVRTIFHDGELIEWFEYGGNPYFFKLLVGTGTSDPELLRKVLEAVNAVKNARSWLEEFIVAQPTRLDLWHASVTVRDVKTQIFMMLTPTESMGPIYIGLSMCIYKIITISAPLD